MRFYILDKRHLLSCGLIAGLLFGSANDAGAGMGENCIEGYGNRCSRIIKSKKYRNRPKYVAEAYVNRGVWNQGFRKFDLAIADYSSAIGLFPKYGYAFFRRATTFADKGDQSRALADYSRALNIAPVRGGKTGYHIRAYRRRGDIYANMRNFEQAIADYSASIRLESGVTTRFKSIDAYYGRGLAFANRGDFPRAMADLDKVLAMNPKSTRAHSSRGLVYYATGRYARAIKSFDKALNLKPNYAEAARYRRLAIEKNGN